MLGDLNNEQRDFLGLSVDSGQTLLGMISDLLDISKMEEGSMQLEYSTVHVSQLANKFVNDAREIVKTGDIVKVKVLEVDAARKRISLTMKLGEAARRACDVRCDTASPGHERRLGRGRSDVYLG